MALFDFLRGKGKEAPKKEPPKEEAPQSRELSPVEQNRENSVASARKIISAIDALLFSMRTPNKYPKLTEEDIASLAERFNNLQKVLGATHCDCDVSELDGYILSLVSNLERQLAKSPMEEWDRTIKVLNDAVKARIQSEYDIRMAGLNTTELFCEHTNEIYQSQIETYNDMLAQASPNDLMMLQATISLTEANLKSNKDRLAHIRMMRKQLESAQESPSAELLRAIDDSMSGIRDSLTEIIKVAEYNEEEIRRRTVDAKVLVDRMTEADQKLRDALGVAETQAVAQGERFQQAAQAVAQSVPEAQQQREPEAVAE